MKSTIARIGHECDARRSIECTGWIAPTEEYFVETLPPWSFDEEVLLGLDEDGEPVVEYVRPDRNPDGGRRGWRHTLTCKACI